MIGFKYHIQLNEVFVLGKKTPQNGDVVVAFRKWVYLVDDDNFEELKSEMVKNLKVNKSSASGISTPYDWEQYVNNEDNADIIAGTVSSGLLEIRVFDWRQSSASKTLEKALKALRLRGVDISFFDIASSDDDSLLQGREEFLIPLAKKTFYHGTSFASFGGRGNILSKGIMPSPGRTNFAKVKHTDKVFVTLNKEKAFFHAITSSNNSNSFPLIISLTIPDVDKLVLDYDVALQFYGKSNPRTIKLGFKDIQKFAAQGNKYAMAAQSKTISDLAKRQRNKQEDLNTKLGVFGYLGRISAPNFIDVIFDQDAFEQWYIETEIFGSGEKGNPGPLSSWYPVPAKKFNKFLIDIEDEANQRMKDDEDEEY